ncbi:TetR/AcrR family transcriptional regulator C-terminal domain-containing protein [Planococcus lenghuensis]|uniref:Transcriptional regulator TetR C-terminal Firmicutes type domain-containing protein n=1 Tax=Planococcus lenghuensis TaxID=2213202 RepID=A0A1Q2KVH1_9BACL|nr:TetR/AcrR family transcriptional regulator C-terminal domain-containing protein [Planococcus lenghuensis]AQQ52189.1 hypothetical protein B0X71_03050 [Planococcus lenghuensis]
MSINKEFHDRRIRKSKAALKEALLTLLLQDELKDISVTSIVEQADLNRGTFYKHYQVKEELLAEIIRDAEADLVRAYREPYRNRHRFDVGSLSASAVKVFDHVAAYADFYQLIVRPGELAGLQHQTCALLRDLALQDLLNRTASPNVNPQLLAGFYAYAIFGLIVEWINSGFDYSADYMAEQLVEIIHQSQPAIIHRQTAGNDNG